MDKDDAVYIFHYVCIYSRVYIYIYTYIYTHTMSYHSVIKKNEILPFATTWMDLEDILLSELRERHTV